MELRYYDPQIGLFYSNDPVVFNVSNSMMFNRYGYASNNQYMYVDSDGKEGKSSLSIGVAAAAYTDFFTPDPSDVAAPVKIAAYGAALVGTVIGGAISLGLVRTILNLQRIMR